MNGLVESPAGGAAEAPGMASQAIRVSNLSKCYQIYDRPQDRLKQTLWRGRKRFYREFWALRDVSFDVARGDTVGIIGRNGSGKSTLLQMIAGTLTPTAGGVQVRGRAAALLELGTGFNPDFTGRENVYVNGAILGLSRADVERHFQQIESFAGIGGFIDQPVKIYSSGMIVRLAFSVAVNVEPDILIVDEALAVGDMEFQFKCMERLERLTRSGTTLLFVSHDTQLVKAFCNRAIYLEGGRIRAVGPADQVTELYTLDVRDSQRMALGSEHAVAPKPFLGEGNGIAFGTSQGRITRASFVETGGLRASFSAGDRIRIRVDLDYDASLRDPVVSMLVMDRRMVPLTGKQCPLPKESSSTAGTHRASVLYTFDCRFGNDSYFVTVRLEDRWWGSYTTLVDKQVGLLSFEVQRSRDATLGLIDIGIDCEVLPEPGNS